MCCDCAHVARLCKCAQLFLRSPFSRTRVHSDVIIAQLTLSPCVYVVVWEPGEWLMFMAILRGITRTATTKQCCWMQLNPEIFAHIDHFRCDSFLKSWSNRGGSHAATQLHRRDLLHTHNNYRPIIYNTLLHSINSQLTNKCRVQAVLWWQTGQCSVCNRLRYHRQTERYSGNCITDRSILIVATNPGQNVDTLGGVLLPVEAALHMQRFPFRWGSARRRQWRCAIANELTASTAGNDGRCIIGDRMCSICVAGQTLWSLCCFVVVTGCHC